jgi:hypothetical protein
MPTQLQFRRGNTAQTAAFTGALAEITVDTDRQVVVVHDGSTAGGFPAATLAFAQAAFNTANSGGSANNSAQAAFNAANAATVIADSAYDQANLASYYANIASGIANTKVSKSGDTITGTLVVTDNVSANIIIANHQFYSGLATLQATPLPNLIAQFTGDSDTYVQVNAQNIDPYGSADYVVTADVGNDTEYFIDMGITNSLYALNEFPFHGLDGYLVVQGSEGQLGGNLVIGTSTTGTQVNIIAGGNTDAHIAATFDSDANTTLHGYVLPHQGNMYDLGEEARPWHSLWLGPDSLNIGSIKLSQNTTTNTLVITGATDIVLGGSNTPSSANVSNVANAAYAQANSASSFANGAFDQANSAASFANGAFTKANSGTILAQAAFDAANNVAPQIEPAFAQANSAASFANGAFRHANSAYALANNSLDRTTGGTVSGDLTVTGNLVINGTTTTVNTTTVSTTDSLIKLANNNTSDSIDIGFYGTYNDGSQKYTGLIKQAGGNYFLFNKLTNDPSGNVLIPGSLTASNTATLTANLTSYSVTINGRDVENYLQSAYDAANTADSKAVSAGSFANGAFVTANSAASFANGAFDQANSAASFANGAFGQANSAASFANGAFVSANSAGSFANGAFDKANSANVLAQSGYDKANSAGSFANGAFVTANASFDAANNRVLKSGDTMTGVLVISNTTTSSSNITGALTVSGGVGVTGSIYADGLYDSGNRVLTIANAAFESGNSGIAAALVASYYANLAFDKANSAYDKANSAGSFANGAFDAANSAASFANGAFEHANSAGSFANGAFVTANSAASFANGAFTKANSAFDTANSAGSFANGAFEHANSAGSFANGAFGQANSAASFANGAFTHSNSAYNQANTTSTVAISAGDFANAAFLRANSAYGEANTANSLAQHAFDAANTKFSSTGGTITGIVDIANTTQSVDPLSGALIVAGGVGIGKDLNVQGNTIVSGSLTVTGSQFITSTTTTSYSNPVIYLHRPTAGYIPAADGYDIGIVHEFYDPTDGKYVVLGGSGNGTTATLSVSDTWLAQVGDVVTITGVVPSGFNGTWKVTASSAGSISFLNTTNASVNTTGQLGTVYRNTEIQLSGGTWVSQVANVSFSLGSPAITLTPGANVTITGCTPSAYNGNYTILASGPGYFTYTIGNPNPGSITVAGKVTIGNRHAFAGWAADTGYWEFYQSGTFDNANTFHGLYGTVKAGRVLASPPQSVSAADLTAGGFLQVPTSTVYDTSTAANGIVAQVSTPVSLGIVTIGAANANVHYTNSTTLYIAGAPVAGNNVTFDSNATYALEVASGDTLLVGNLIFSGANHGIQFTNGAGASSGPITSNNTITGNNIVANTGVTINTSSYYTSTVTTVNTTSQTTVYSFDKATYRTAKLIAQMTSGSVYHSIELFLIHDGTTVYLSQYAEIKTGASLGSIDASISGSNVILQLTAANSPTTIRVAATLIPV